VPHPRVAVLDIGGVLIAWDPRNLFGKLFADKAEMEHFLSSVCTPEWNHRQDEGRPLAEAISTLTSEWPHYADMIAAYYGRWTEMIGGVIQDSVQILADLCEHHRPVYALTNWSSETFPWALDHFPFLSWFDGIVVSGDERVAKPDPGLYQILLDRYGLQPADVFFTDDRLENVEAARQSGWDAVVFESPHQLRSELGQRGFRV
jgi:2-haloacid dehalogenase